MASEKTVMVTNVGETDVAVVVGRLTVNLNQHDGHKQLLATGHCSR